MSGPSNNELQEEFHLPNNTYKLLTPLLTSGFLCCCVGTLTLVIINSNNPGETFKVNKLAS